MHVHVYIHMCLDVCARTRVYEDPRLMSEVLFNCSLPESLRQGLSLEPTIQASLASQFTPCLCLLKTGMTGRPHAHQDVHGFWG